MRQQLRLLDVVHGTEAALQRGCECVQCSELRELPEQPAQAEPGESKASQYRAQAKGKCPPDKHGTESGYDYYGCRCTVCVDAYSILQRVRRANRIERRAQELMNDRTN